MRGARSLFISRVLISQMIPVQHLFINSEGVFFFFFLTVSSGANPKTKPAVQDKEPFPDHSDTQLYSVWSYLYLLVFTTQKVIMSGFTIELSVKSHTSSSSCSVVSNSLRPHGLPGSSVHRILQVRILVKSSQ